ncbi:MAG: DUF4159 domain-containing protein [Bacteroidales bacterium]
MRILKRFCFLSLVLCVVGVLFGADKYSYQIALMKYRGGGDWYANPTSLPNLVRFCNSNLRTKISEDIATVEVGSSDLFQYPFVHMTGHGNVVFSQSEAENLRDYLVAGGFLHIDDNYGMDSYIRPQMKKVFPDLDFIELPIDFPLINKVYSFPDGMPKIHEHDQKAPKAYGLFYDNRLVCLYTWETDLGDGWEDQEVHKDSEDIRLKALKMGANIISYALEE